MHGALLSGVQQLFQRQRNGDAGFYKRVVATHVVLLHFAAQAQEAVSLQLYAGAGALDGGSISVLEPVATAVDAHRYGCKGFATKLDPVPSRDGS